MLVTGSAQADNRLNLSVHPKTGLSVGDRTCLTAEVTNRRGRPVSRVQVLLLAKRKKTDPSGVARLCGRFRYPGTQTIHAFKGKHHDLAKVRVRAAGVSAPRDDEWKRIEIQLPSYPGAYWGGNCGNLGFPQEDGACSGIPNSGTSSFLFQPLGFIRTRWHEPDWPYSYITDIEFDQPGQGGATMRGWWDARGWPSDTAHEHFYVTSLVENDDHRYAWSGGTDVLKAGQPGGPLLAKFSEHITDPFGVDGYTFHVSGYAFRSLK